MNLHGNVLIGQSAVGFQILDPTVARHPILVPSFLATRARSHGMADDDDPAR